MTDAGRGERLLEGQLHIHHVQFDTQALGRRHHRLSYEQSIRPYKARRLRAHGGAAPPAQRTLHSSTSVEKFTPARGSPSAWARRHRGPPDRRHRHGRQDADAWTEPLSNDHAAGRVRRHRVRPVALVPRRPARQHLLARPRRRHPHVGPRPGRSADRRAQGLDLPRPARRARRSTRARTSTSTPTRPLAPGLVDGSFRELALWTIDDNPITDSTLNLRAEPWADRLGAGRRPVDCCSAPGRTATRSRRCRWPTAATRSCIRTINVGDAIDTLHIDGHRFRWRSALHRTRRQAGRDCRSTRCTTASPSASRRSSRAAPAA